MIQQGVMKQLPCHTRKCSVSELMFTELGPWIEIWRALNSKTGSNSGVSQFLVQALELTGHDIELLVSLDSVYFEHEEAERQKRQSQSRRR